MSFQWGDAPRRSELLWYLVLFWLLCGANILVWNGACARMGLR